MKNFALKDLDGFVSERHNIALLPLQFGFW